ncbi:DUF72 domain-containing protein [Chitinophaga lutea]|uniref:DUF72 domain-containing protein n=1 Tax=Chitinophaga lutea TaxID=2488634 RepID=A0A3N4Q3C2_9BACT|nr:DUF72 domain-containing protein [Chitinophaga lutea]RPE13709.1 DUF72 domain-containing protein [Chitinophaga lutea]
MAHSLHIGTSGWSYKDWKGLYYPETLKPTEYLAYFSREFKCVEINTSFYHLPRAQTVLNWAAAVPGDFRFCPKLSRYISHYQKLNDPSESLERFFSVFDPVKEKLGPVLVQLPANAPFKREVAEHFFTVLQKQYSDYVFALEIRHESWLEAQSVELLRQYGISLVIAQSAMPFPYHELVTAKDIYLRFHGPGKLYASKYHHQTMKAYARKCAQWLRDKHRVWVFFNNDFYGYAIENARQLEQYIEAEMKHG